MLEKHTHIIALALLLINTNVNATIIDKVYVCNKLNNECVTVDSDGQLGVVQEGVIDSNNITVVPLLADAVFTGTSTDVLNVSTIKISLNTDVASATNGLSIQFSKDGTNWDWMDNYTVLGPNFNEEISVSPSAQYFRIVYTNGTSDQTYFRMSTFLSQKAVKNSSHRIKDDLTEQDDVEAVKSVLSYQKTTDGTVKNVSIQNPLPVDGDSVYSKDIWESESAIGDFSGSITDLFDNLQTVITNSTSDNPKTLLIVFNRTVISNVIGFGCEGGGNFSNVKVEIINSGTVYTTVYDDSADNTKYTTLTAQLPATAGFNGLRITFHTSDTICLSNIVIPKTRGVVARLQAVKPDGTVIDLNATAGGNQKFSLEEYDNTFLTNPLPVQLRDASGNQAAYISNKLRTSSMPYTYDIAEGNIANHDPLLKFGTRSATAANTASTIWEGPTALYAYMSTAQQLKVVSTSANDTSAGTGIRTLKVIGLDSNYDEIEESVTMNGTTQVTTTNSYLRVFRAYGETSGSLYTNAGTISVLDNAGTTTQAIINPGDGQTLMTMWTVPNGKTAYIVRGGVSTESNKGAEISLFVRKLDGGILYPWLIKYRGYIFSGAVGIPVVIPFEIPEKTDIEMRVLTPSAAGTTSTGATFELWYE